MFDTWQGWVWLIGAILFTIGGFGGWMINRTESRDDDGTDEYRRKCAVNAFQCMVVTYTAVIWPLYAVAFFFWLLWKLGKVSHETYVEGHRERAR